MKIAITDANLLIELAELGLIGPLFTIPAEIHCTVDVIRQLPLNIQQQLPKELPHPNWFVHSLEGEECLSMYAAAICQGMTHAERTGFFLAAKINATVLWTNALSKLHAGDRAAACHGMLWIIELLAESGVISKETAIATVNRWLHIHPACKENNAVMREAEEKIRGWQRQ